MDHDPDNTFDNDALNGDIRKTVYIKDMYGDWFLDYASYVILERAVPALLDGLKPVQRRILHSMKTMDDGRFHKVANIIGQTMQFHPHGDAAIGDALVNLGQKDLLIETQGNWGDFRTGDRAAAPRYIEARLSKFALDVVFNPQTTQWQLSYDGRKSEPVLLPVKFPLSLAQGVEGIAVGLATRIMPHNFNELIQASINILEGKNIRILPDFPTGGMADFSNYNEGQKGGKIRVRAKIESMDKRTLVIHDIPYGTTTTGLMESIVKANDNNKIKIKRVIDNTAKNIEIIIELPPAVSPQVTMDALYAFTDCEVSISPNACVIHDEKPCFYSVNEILRRSTENTVDLLRSELEIRRHELAEKWHFASLEKIFIEKRIYRDIEECETWEAVLDAIKNGFKPYKKLFKREITKDDIIRLTEIKIKRISRYNTFKADDAIRDIENEMEEVARNLAHLTDYAIAYFNSLLEKYGRGKERKTDIRSFENILVAQVAVANQKLYVNRKEGFIGYGLKKDDYVCDCSDLDDVIIFLKNGTFLVTRISEKAFIGKDIIHVDVWKKNDNRMIYNMVYRDDASGISFVKRFAVTAVTREKTYDLTRGSKKPTVLYFTANPNSESEVITVTLHSKCRARNKVFDFDFAGLAIKGRTAGGNRITKYPAHKVVQKSAGISTLGGLDIWYDDTVGRLNTDERGRYLGNFEGDDLILAVDRSGTYVLTSYELTNHYDPEKLLIIEKFNPKTVISAVHYDSESQFYYVKRFMIETLATDRTFKFISDSEGSRLATVSTNVHPWVEIVYVKGRAKEHITEKISLNEVVDVKGWKAKGNRLSKFPIIQIELCNTDKTSQVTSRSTGNEEQVNGANNSLEPGNQDPKSGASLEAIATVTVAPNRKRKDVLSSSGKEKLSEPPIQRNLFDHDD